MSGTVLKRFSRSKGGRDVASQSFWLLGIKMVTLHTLREPLLLEDICVHGCLETKWEI